RLCRYAHAQRYERKVASRPASAPCMILYFCIIAPPPPRSTLFPYTTLFRSRERRHRARGVPRRGPHRGDERHAHAGGHARRRARSEEHTSELQSRVDLVCRLLLEKKKDLIN